MITTPDGVIAERHLYYDQLHHAHDLKAVVDELREEVVHGNACCKTSVDG